MLVPCGISIEFSMGILWTVRKIVRLKKEKKTLRG